MIGAGSVNTGKFTVHQRENQSSRKGRTAGFMGELKYFLVPRLKRALPGCRQLYTEPNSSELGLKSPPRWPSPYGMELVLEGEGLIAPLADECIDGIERILIPWFEPSGVV